MVAIDFCVKETPLRIVTNCPACWQPENCTNTACCGAKSMSYVGQFPPPSFVVGMEGLASIPDGKIGSPHDKKRAVSSRLSVIAFELALGDDRGLADRSLADRSLTDRSLADHGGRGLAGRQISGGSSAHESER